MKHKIFLCCLAALTAAAFTLRADGIGDMRGLALQNIKIPFYKEKQLQLVAFADTGRREDQLMLCGNTFLDILLETADVDRIPDGWRVRLYPLKAPLPEVLKFWSSRRETSKAVLFTPDSSIDQSRGEAFGDDPVFMRSPMLDLDGIGFQADFNNNVIEVTSEVSITARKSDADPRKLLTGAPAPERYEPVHATSDSLRLDMTNNELMLIGHVKVIDGPSTLTCDRLTVFLSDDAPEPDPAAPMLKGVSRVLADGDAVLVRVPDDPSGDTVTAKSDHMEYDLKTGIIVLTGDSAEPLVLRGINDRLSGTRIEILRRENRYFVHGNCRVVSSERDAEGKVTGVKTITSARADFDGNTEESNFYEHVTAVDGDTTLNCDRLRILMKKNRSREMEKVFAEGRVRIVSRSEKDDPQSPGGKKTAQSTVNAELAELNYTVNKLIFYRNVKVRDAESALDCDRLDLFLKDKRHASGQVSGAPLGGGMGARNKSLTKMIASGRVFMTNSKDEMRTELMTLFFRDLPEGFKPSPGMFQSGGVQLTRIVCDGKVVGVGNAKSAPADRRILNAEHAMWDLLKDYSEFHNKVVVYRGETDALHCRDMYVFTRESSPDEEKTATLKKAADPLDEDPFALDMGENSVPARIALSDGLNLKRIVCKHEVVMVKRASNGQLQRAGGDQAVYRVADKEMILTAEPPRRPWLRSDGRKQFCDIIRSDTETEDLRGIGNVQVMPDDQ